MMPPELRIRHSPEPCTEAHIAAFSEPPCDDATAADGAAAVCFVGVGGAAGVGACAGVGSCAAETVNVDAP